jgi:glycosyltransferase involved in cell wall biosynthesis
MIKIVHLITSFGLGGSETNLWQLVCHMDNSRFSNTIVTMTDVAMLDRSVMQPRLHEAGVPFYSLAMRRGVPSLRAVTQLLRILKKERPQILQTWLYHADLLGLLAGKLGNVPSILWNLQNSFIDMTQYRRMSAIVLRALVSLSTFPDIVLANSQAGLRFHEALGYKPKRWMYLPNPLDLERFSPQPDARVQLRRELGVAPDAILIGLVARFDPMKDHTNFIAAARLLAEYDADLHFVLVGRFIDSNNAALMQLIASSGIAERFHLLGLRPDVNRVTAGFDIACSSSIGEGSPNVIGEAMACGVPCLVTDVGDSAMIVGHAGKVVPPRDPKAFAEACRSLLDLPPHQRQKLGLCARSLAEQRFSLTSVVARYETLYEQLAHGTLA